MPLYVGSKRIPVNMAGEHRRGQRLQIQVCSSITVARPRTLGTPAPQSLLEKTRTIHQCMPFPVASWMLSIIVKQRTAAYTAREEASV